MKSSNNPLSLFSKEANHFEAKLTWDDKNLSKIYTFISLHEKATIVFDADGTIWSDDVSEAFFRWLIAEGKLINVPDNIDLFHHYEFLVKQNHLSGYEWLVTILAGISEQDINRWASDFFHDHFQSRIYTCQKNLISLFQKNNYDVWIVSASHHFIVKAGAHYLGVDESHVLAARLVIENGVLTNKIDPPFTYNHGKVDAIKKFIPNQPNIIFGDSFGDLAMLAYAKDLKFFITHDSTQQKSTVNEAKAMGCGIQYFPLREPLQFENKIHHLQSLSNKA